MAREFRDMCSLALKSVSWRKMDIDFCPLLINLHNNYLLFGLPFSKVSYENEIKYHERYYE